MVRTLRGKTDTCLDRILGSLANYESQHPHAEISAYRQNSVAVRVRIIDQDFSGVSRVQRHNEVWRYFEALPEEDQSQISLLLPYTPEEAVSSIANMEFEDPVPSSLP